MSSATVELPERICTGAIPRGWHAGEHPVFLPWCPWCIIRATPLTAYPRRRITR